jgi:hypothetical protein
MKRVTIDPAMRKQLDADADGKPIEMCDSAGELIGYFLTKHEFYSLLEPPMSDEEWERRLNAGGGRTWPEIRADLEKAHGAAGR